MAQSKFMLPGISSFIVGIMLVSIYSANGHLVKGPEGESMYHIHVGEETVVFPIDEGDIAQLVINQAIESLEAGNTTEAITTLQNAMPLMSQHDTLMSEHDIRFLGVNSTGN